MAEEENALRFSKLLIAAIVLLMVAGFFYLHEIKGKKEIEREEKIESQLYDYEISSITQVEFIVRGDSIQVVKKDKEWLISKPIEYPADPQTVERMILSLRDTKVTSTLEGASNLQQYNLSPALIAVTLTAASGERLPSLWVGDETPLGAEYFAIQEGRKDVLVLSMDIYPIREVSLFALREKRLFPFSRWDISEILLERGSHKIRFKNSAGLWNLIEPIQFPADESKVSALLNALENAEVKKFIDEISPPLSELSPEKSTFRISCRRGTDPGWFSIAFKENEEGSLYAMRSDQRPILIVEKTLFIPAAYDSREFMDTRISKRNRYNIREFEITWGKRSEGARIDAANEWVRADSGAPLDKGDIYLLLSSFMESRCMDFIERSKEAEKQCNYADPLVKATIHGDGFSEEIIFSKDSSGNFCAFNSSARGVIFIVSEKDLEKIRQSIPKSFPG